MTTTEQFWILDRDEFPNASDSQWERITTIHAKYAAFFTEHHREPTCCEFRAMMTDDEAAAFTESIIDGDGNPGPCDETCPTWGDAIRERNRKAVTHAE